MPTGYTAALYEFDGPHDTNAWNRPPPANGTEWRELHIAKVLRDIAYHAAEFAKDRERANERTEWVQALRRSLTGNDRVPA